MNVYTFYFLEHVQGWLVTCSVFLSTPVRQCLGGGAETHCCPLLDPGGSEGEDPAHGRRPGVPAPKGRQSVLVSLH